MSNKLNQIKLYIAASKIYRNSKEQ